MTTPEYVVLNFKSALRRNGMLARLKTHFPDFGWRDSDTDTQGPSLSSGAKDKPHIKIFSEDDLTVLSVFFRQSDKHLEDAEKYRKEFLEFLKAQLIPKLLQ